MRKKICLIVMVLMNSVQLFGQAPGWAWAKSAGGVPNDYIKDMVTDSSGNTYVTGTFQSVTITFGNISLTKTGSAANDIFLVKYDSLGNVIWAKGFGGTSGDYVSSIALDPIANVYMTGYYQGSTTIGNIILNSISNEDLFIAKFDSSGNVLWAKSAGGSDFDYGLSIAVDNVGNCYVAGEFLSPQLFLDTIMLIKPSPFWYDVDIFYAKYDSSGNILWAKNPDVENVGSPRIAVDVVGNVYLTAHTSDTIITFDATTLYSSGNSVGIVFLKFNTTGQVTSASNIPESGYDVIYDLIYSSGNIYITGGYTTTLTFDTITLTNSPGLDSDFFIAKYDTMGHIFWARSGNGTELERGIAITADKSGNIYATGYFNSDSILFGNLLLTNPANQNLLIVKYDNSGNILWAKASDNSSGNVAGFCISPIGNDEVLIGGSFYSLTLTLGNHQLINSDTTHSDVFIAKLGSGIATGITEEETNIITFFPNPTSSHFTITSPSIIDQIEITDVIGRVVYRVKPKSKTAEVRMEREGIYFVTVTSGDERVTRKVVIE